MSERVMQLDGDAVASAFKAVGFKRAIAEQLEEVADLYRADQIPWVIGYSGGKDSTATLQLVWLALRALPPEERAKPVYVISTDTLVENPVVAGWVAGSLDRIGVSAREQDLPITSHRLTPRVDNSFWVNLIGRGYPAPRPPGFRWCTERLKIEPSNRFIHNVVQQNGEAIVVLGMRKAESQARARVMDRLEGKRVREKLSPNKKMPSAYVYTPIEHWTDRDVWMFLMQVANPWGFDNKALLTMYQGATADGECPLVVDDSTPSCGDSRFGCWVCTIVDKDRSMQAMISNDQEKEWMQPLLDLRNEIEARGQEGRRDDRHLRDFRRMGGNLSLDNHGRLIHGPYTQSAREHWLTRLLEVQQRIRAVGPEVVRDIELITLDELHEIRRHWVREKHEFEDRLPAIYEAVLGEPFPGEAIDAHLPVRGDELALLSDLCGEDTLHYATVRELIDVARQHHGMARRAGLPRALERALERGFYDGAEDALERAKRLKFSRDRKEPAQLTFAEPLEPDGVEDAP
ncbi:DNA phosphorothioation system sulfurtransferase DndC [Blastomonas sp.]|uniref:DNA phosphorothioation system sulfurtransferase DndC n=1 Tax=Blastomonas sp. TaxID=1909299 RepID=UPI00406A2C30